MGKKKKAPLNSNGMITKEEYTAYVENQRTTEPSMLVNITDLISKREHNTRPNVQLNNTKYEGNTLDSNRPSRHVGKHREQNKKKLSRIGREKIENSDKNSTPTTFSYIDNSTTDKLHDSTENFIKEMVTLQQKLFERNPLKGDYQRRYVTGFHEVTKYLKANRIKVLIIAEDLRVSQVDGVLHKKIEEIIALAQQNNIPYIFSLKRRKIGTLTLKHVPVSSIGVMNYDGANDTYKELAEEIVVCKNSFASLQSTDQVQESSGLLETLKTMVLEDRYNKSQYLYR